MLSIFSQRLRELLTPWAKMALVTAIFTAMLTPSMAHSGTSLEDLRADGQLRAKVSIDTQGKLYQRAPFILSVEIATLRWFSRGTRVRDFRIPKAVVRPVSSFADNSSRRIDGETWTVQRWRFRVFPQDSGPLEIPKLRVFSSINTVDDGVVEGELVLDATSVQITSPPGLENASVWIASPSLTIEQDWEGLMENHIAGDAITRTRSFVVQDAPGMMLEASPVSSIQGLSFYEAPATVVDQTHRGTLTGTREESLVITFEAPGHYEIPGLDYLWFNTETGAIETLSLPALVVEVLASEPTAEEPEKREGELLTRPFVIGVAAALALLLFWGLYNSAPFTQLRQALNRRSQGRRAYSAYLQALKQKNSAECIQLLHQQLAYAGSREQLREAVRGYSAASELGPKDRTNMPSCERSLQLLLAHAYGNAEELPDLQNAQALWKCISQRSRKNVVPSRLQLNPGSP